MGHDVQLRLIGTHLGVVLIGLLLLGLAFTVILANRITAAHESDLRYETSALAAQLDRALTRNASQASIQTLIRHDSELMGKRILLLNRSGQVRYDSTRWTPFSRGSWHLLDRSAVHRGRLSQMAAANQLGLQAPLMLHGQVAGAVTLVETTPDSGLPWQQILPALLATLALVFLLWSLVGLHLVRAIIRPLRQVSDALVLVRGGRYDLPVPEEGWSEARELARRYNEMVAEVARSHQMLRDFMANAAHELKTPVALVSGFARSLVDGTAEGADARDAVDYIQTESTHLVHIVDQLFALASLEADPEALIPEPCNPAVLLSHVTERFAPRAQTEGRHLTCDAPERVPTCTWDVERVTSALANLVGNALDHTPPGGLVSLRLAVGEDLIFTVRDSGPGIAPEELPHLFDRFYRGKASQRREGHAGLGLAIVREVAQRHGGTVQVESRLGGGSCFTLTLPPHLHLRTSLEVTA